MIDAGWYCGNGEPFDLGATVEAHCAEMLAWAREHGGRLVVRRCQGRPFIKGPGQPRKTATAAVIVFDCPEGAFWFKMRFG